MKKCCSHCKILLDLSEFHRRKNGKNGLAAECKICRREQRKRLRPENAEKLIQKAKEWRRNNPKRVAATAKRHWLKKKYGITIHEYSAMLISQGGCCFLCGKKAEEFKKGLAVDHCHLTGKVRSLLCGVCNTGLGKFREDPNLLMKAARYITSFRRA